jgi:hypothetical protein
MSIRILFFFSVALSLYSCSIDTIPRQYLDTVPTKSRPHVLAVYMDGTNNKSNKILSRNTHVKTLHSLTDTAIRSLYIEGVGTKKKILGLFPGVGTKSRIVKAYCFLTQHYSPGDSICLFGFSRGANQCRILSNLVYTFGILDLSKVADENDKRKIINKAYKLYRGYYPASDKKYKVAYYIDSTWNFKNPQAKVKYDTTGKDRIELMGLFETVEAFVVDNKETITPRKDHLNQVANVRKVFHAVALDDNRALTYTPILLTSQDVVVGEGNDINKIIEEVWFNGSHRDVGGGHKKKPVLQTISLNWMLSKAKPYKLFNGYNITNYTYAPVHNMQRLFLMQLFLRNRNRSITDYYKQMSRAYNNGKLKVHRSVIQRLQEGVIQEFKTTRKREDWYDLEPFKKCFTAVGAKRIFKKDCDCIEVVD